MGGAFYPDAAGTVPAPCATLPPLAVRMAVNFRWVSQRRVRYKLGSDLNRWVPAEGVARGRTTGTVAGLKKKGDRHEG
jgi:hypothetical protein